jgi:ribosomal protein L44E
MSVRLSRGDRSAAPELVAQLEALRTKRQCAQNRMTYLSAAGSPESQDELRDLSRRTASMSIEIDKMLDQIKAVATEVRHTKATETFVHVQEIHTSHQQEQADLGKIKVQMEKTLKQQQRDIAAVAKLQMLQDRTSASTEAALKSVDKLVVMLDPVADAAPEPSSASVSGKRSTAVADLEKLDLDESDGLYSTSDEPSVECEDTPAAYAAFRDSAIVSVPVALAEASTPEKRPLYCRYCKKKLASRQTKEKHEKDACAKRPLADVADTTSGQKKERPTKKSKADEVPEIEPLQYKCGQCGWYTARKGSYTKHLKQCVNA